ncbi:MAG: Glu-tRNA(Gln) amidotransferase subunit GatE [Candidatus Micrarchaeota archaeon]|nr:Glu-tRNA(Gln) amidotransferase subunit GatE [Candidatus Micrarchaeota archaeon]
MRCGLEIHQRVEGKKLFTATLAQMPDAEIEKLPSIKFFRQLNPAAGELGQIDKAAVYESKKAKTFFYIAPFKNCSLVDMDEEPPDLINQDALIYALSFSKFIGAKIVDEIYVMRKIVVDGSNVSGFQRTALVSLGGEIKGSINVPIQTVCIEEESAGILSQSYDSTNYRLDRQGIALIEISTEPVFLNSSDAKKAALQIGQLLRLMPLTMRGIGSIRQDVNISVEGGARVEIKGLQNIELLELLINNEVKRQTQLIEILKEIKKRKIDFSSILTKDVSKIFENSACNIFLNALKNGGVVYALKIPKFRGLLGTELYTNKRFATEVLDYIKAYCPLKGLIHSDENLEKYKISSSELNQLKKELELEEEDSFVLIAEKKEIVLYAIDLLIERIKQDSLVSETRKANEDGSSSFLRPIGSWMRLYPETDLRPISTKPYLKSLIKIVPYSERLAKYEKLIGRDLALQILNSHNLFLFEEFLEHGLEPKQSAIVLEKHLVEFRREGLAIENLTKEVLIKALRLYSQKKINAFALAELLRQALLSNNFDLEELVKQKNLYQLTEKETEKLFEQEGRDIKKFMQKYRLIANMDFFNKK